jgi:hypothetical protein
MQTEATVEAGKAEVAEMTGPTADEGAAELGKLANVDEGGPAAEGADAQDEGGEEPAKLFNEKQQEVFNERVGKEVEKTRKAQERSQELEAEVAKLKETQGADALEIARATKLHPSYLTKEEAEAIKSANDLEAEETWLRKHAANGYEAKDPAKSKTPEEIVERLGEVQTALRRLSPKADALYEARLKEQLADMELGRKIRLERAAAAQKAKAAGSAKAPVAATAGGGGGTGTRPIAERAEKRGQSVDRFEKSGASRHAAARELAEMVPA